ncbi:MAG: ribosome silencing factor [Clostridia bacterium]|nr:ribosome silencing factor [Clostridia bacterium]
MEQLEKHPDLSSADSLAVAQAACRILSQKLSLDVKLISMKESALTDYYVIGYGRSSTHVKALANDVADELAASGVYARRIEGLDGGEWVLVDLGDVIVHVFGREASEFYRFERLFKPDAFLPLPEENDIHE